MFIFHSNHVESIQANKDANRDTKQSSIDGKSDIGKDDTSTTSKNNIAKDTNKVESNQDVKKPPTSRSSTSDTSNTGNTTPGSSGDNNKDNKNWWEDLSEARIRQIGLGVAVAIAAAYYLYATDRSPTREINWQQFRVNYLEKGLVSC